MLLALALRLPCDVFQISTSKPEISTKIKTNELDSLRVVRFILFFFGNFRPRSMNDKHEDLQKILTISDKMLEQAKLALWDEVTELEAIRREWIELFFHESVEAEFISAVKQAIQTILASDEQILALGQVEKHDIGQQIKQLEQGKKAVKAYGS
jgi:Flagellar protein FliT